MTKSQLVHMLLNSFPWCPWPGFSEGPGDIESLSVQGEPEEPLLLSHTSLLSALCVTVSLPRWTWP